MEEFIDDRPNNQVDILQLSKEIEQLELAGFTVVRRTTRIQGEDGRWYTPEGRVPHIYVEVNPLSDVDRQRLQDVITNHVSTHEEN